MTKKRTGCLTYIYIYTFENIIYLTVILYFIHSKKVVENYVVLYIYIIQDDLNIHTWLAKMYFEEIVEHDDDNMTVARLSLLK